MFTTPSEQRLGYAALTAPGLVREHNEDALLCCPPLSLWAVADGMGGHQRGEVASALALKSLQRLVRKGQSLADAIQGAHAAILAEAASDPESRGMGTTLVTVRFAGAEFQLAWVGDSRAYRVGPGGIEQLSRDHSWVQAMVDAGQLTPEQALHHPRRNVVTQCLGQADQELRIDQVEGRLGDGELLLLCSDGLTGELGDTRIQQICGAAATLEAMVSELVEEANRMGGRDNISCIVLALDGQAAAPVAERPRGFFEKLLKPAKS
jgi:protein phosphatase